MLGIFIFSSLVEGGRKKDETNDDDIPNEARLYHYLAERYDRVNPDREIIPVSNITETQLVKLGIALVSFLHFDPDSSIGLFNVWERYTWKDSLLTWNPGDYGFIDDIRMPIRQIWKPDIVLYNNGDPDAKSGDVLAVVSSDGSVLYVLPVQYKILCQQPDSGKVECVFHYGSWTYDGYRLDLGFFDDTEDVDVHNYIHNENYKLLEHSAKRREKFYPCCDEPYPDLTFTLIFEKTAEWWDAKQ